MRGPAGDEGLLLEKMKGLMVAGPGRLERWLDEQDDEFWSDRACVVVCGFLVAVKRALEKECVELRAQAERLMDEMRRARETVARIDGAARRGLVAEFDREMKEHMVQWQHGREHVAKASRECFAEFEKLAQRLGGTDDANILSEMRRFWQGMQEPEKNTVAPELAAKMDEPAS